jgi:hypothetical protein
VDELEWTSSISDVSCLRVLGLCVDAVNDLQEGHFHNYLQVDLILMTYVKRLAYKAICIVNVLLASWRGGYKSRHTHTEEEFNTACEK